MTPLNVYGIFFTIGKIKFVIFLFLLLLKVYDGLKYFMGPLKEITSRFAYSFYYFCFLLH